HLFAVDHVQHAPVRELWNEVPDGFFGCVGVVGAFGQRGGDRRGDNATRFRSRLSAAKDAERDAGNGDRNDEQGQRHAAWNYFTCRPPSTRTVSPVTKSLSRNAMTIFTISPSPPHRPSGVACTTARDSSSEVDGGARIGPGATALTRMLSAANSSASA